MLNNRYSKGKAYKKGVGEGRTKEINPTLDVPDVDTIFCPPSICVPNPEKSKNIILSPWGSKNI